MIDLAETGQHPTALFIVRADSRVVPNLITDTAPGDLFVLRNVGNFVAPYKPDAEFHATASGIEYAVTALKVSNIIICGHTHCGAIGALYSDIEDTPFVHTKKWFSLGDKAKSLATLSIDKGASHEQLLRLTEILSVVFQIENLITYPYVKQGVEDGSIQIHAWLYDIESGAIEYYDPDASDFKSLTSLDKK